MIVVDCDLKAMISFTSHLVAPRTLSEDVLKNTTLPLENPTFAKSVLGNAATTDLFLEKQHEFLAPVIRKYKEVKGDFRRLWITRINAAARQNGLSYGTFMHGLKLAGIEIDRKVLADIAVRDADTFRRFADAAREALPA